MDSQPLEKPNPIEYNKPETNRRRTIIAAVIFCLVVLTAIGVLLYRQHQDKKVRQTNSTAVTAFSNISFDSMVEWNDEYRLHVMYPITEQSHLNLLAKAKIDTYVTDFKKQVAEKPKGGEPYELNIKGVVNYASKTAVNFVYSGSQFTGGQKQNVTVNALFDRISGKEIQTADLFKNSTYLQVMSDSVRKALPDILGTMNYNKTLVEQGTTPSAKHFSQFEIKDAQTIHIIFEPGQVATSSVGTVKVPVALNNLNADLNDSIVGTIFPDYLAQVQAAEKKEAEEVAAAKRKTAEAAQNKPGSSLPANGNTDCNKVKCIALTFDDGPGPGTASILDTLKEHNVHATFMVVGSRVAAGASHVQREVAEGHDIGNHTWDHADLSKLSAADVASEIDRTQDAVAKATGGKRPFFIRPPYGSYNKTVESEVNMPLILWSVDPDDWKDRNADIIHQRVMAAAKPGAIILSHDLYPTTAAAYERIIPELIQQGYTLVTVSDLLDITPATTSGVFSSRK